MVNSVEGPGPDRAVVEEAAAAAVLKKPRFQPFNPHVGSILFCCSGVLHCMEQIEALAPWGSACVNNGMTVTYNYLFILGPLVDIELSSEIKGPQQ